MENSQTKQGSFSFGNFRPAASKVLCSVASLALLLGVGSQAAFAVPTTITTQTAWDTIIKPITVGDFIINPAAGTTIKSHNFNNPLQLFTINGTAAENSPFALYGAGNLEVNGLLTINTTAEAVQIGSEKIATQSGNLLVSKDGFLTVNGEIHLGGEASSLSANAGGNGLLTVDGGRLFVTTDLSVGGEAELNAAGGDGMLVVQNGGTVIVGNEIRLMGESNIAPGGSGDIVVTGGYLTALNFIVEPTIFMAAPVNSSLNVLGTGTTWETQAIVRLGNQHIDWVRQRKPVSTVFHSITAVGNAVTAPIRYGLDLSRTTWSFGGTAADDSTFGTNSLTIVNTKGIATTGFAGIHLDQNNGTKNPVVFENGSTLLLAMDGVKPGQTIKAIDDTTTNITGQWTNYYTTSRIVGNLPTIHNGTDISVPTVLRDLNKTLPGTSQQAKNLLVAMATQIGVDASDDPAISNGQRFFSRATDYRFVENKAESTTIIESALNASSASGIQGTTFAASNTTAYAVENRIRETIGSASGLASGSYSRGMVFWGSPLYRTDKVSGMKMGNYKSGYTSNMLGVSLGADMQLKENMLLGVAFHIGSLCAKSKGDFYRTDTNGMFAAANLYGAWKMDNITLSGDLGLTYTTHSLTQRVPAGMLMRNNAATVYSTALSFGLRGDYRLQTSFMDIVPHIGLRYTGIFTNPFGLKNMNAPILDMRVANQHILTLPIGVTLEKDIVTASGWKVKPQLDLGVIPAVGNLKAKTRSTIPGVVYTSTTTAQVVDTWTFDGTAGLEVAKDGMNFGINYNFQASRHRTGHAVFASFRYAF